jgi:uncharacterized surface protein with fasciclin (FAS1) repeats
MTCHSTFKENNIMHLRKPLTILIAVLALGLCAFSVAGCGSDDSSSSSNAAMGETQSTSDAMANDDIVATAAATKDLSTLVSLVKLAGLVETLQGKGPFTVFAPDNAAFAKVDPATVADLKKPANKDQLSKILTYHVVPGDYDAAAITKIANDGGTLTTVEGEKLTPEVDGSTVKIKDANGDSVTVQKADIKTSNGTVHVIDGVLMPKS